MKSLIVLTITIAHQQPLQSNNQSIVSIRQFMLEQMLPFRYADGNVHHATVIVASASRPYKLEEG